MGFVLPMGGGCADSVICIIGPPASGKSTLCGELTQALNGAVFRMGDRCELEAARDRVFRDAVASTADPLGWVAPEQVATVVLRAFGSVSGGLDVASRAAILDNFPGHASQVLLLRGLLTSGSSTIAGRKLLVFECHATDEAVRGRATLRKVCRQCSTPAGPHALGPCTQCGGLLVRREDDVSAKLAQRLARFREYAPHLRRSLQRYAAYYWDLPDIDTAVDLATQSLYSIHQ